MAVIEEEPVRRGMTRPSVPGIQVSERPMTSADARQFGARAPTPAAPVAAAVPAAPVAPSIPGMDVNERPMARGEARGFVRDPGPGNPRVVGGFSPEGRAFQQGMSAPAPASAPAAAPRLGIVRGVAERVAKAPVKGGSAALAYGLINEGAQAYDTATAPNSTGLDVAQQVAEGSGRLAAAGLGAKAGAAVGALGGPFAGLTVPLGAVVGGGLGFWGATKAMEKGRELVGTDPRAAVDRVTQGATAAPSAAAVPGAPAAPAPRAAGFSAGAGRGSPADPNRTDVEPTSIGFGPARDFSRELAAVPATLPADMRDGVVLRTTDANGRPVYSGRNVGEGAQMVDGMGRGFRGRGTVSTVPGMAPGEAQAILDRPFDPRNAMSPAQRAQYDAEVAQAAAINQATAARGAGSPTVGDLLRIGMRRRAGDLEQQQNDIQTSRANVALGMRRQADSEATNAVNREQTQVETQSARQLQALQAEYLAAESDAERSAAAKKIQALMGKSEAPNRYTVIPGGSVVDPTTGLAVQQPSMVLDNASGQLVDLGTGGSARGAPSGQTQPYPEGTRLQVPGGKTYVVRDGKPVEE